MGLFDFFTRPAKPAKFAELFIEQARAHGLAREFEYNQADFCILLDGTQGWVINLHNIYREYCQAARKDRSAVLEKFVNSLKVTDVPATWPEARTHVMPILRARAQSEYMRLTSQLQKTDKPYRELAAPFGDDAQLMLGFDSELNITTLAHDHLERWQVSFELALAQAMDNLRDRTGDKFVDLGEGVLAGCWDDAFDSSRILLSDLAYRAASGRTQIGSEPVLMIPTRGCFLLTSASNEAGQIHMLSYARQAIEQEGRFVSSAMYRPQPGKIELFQPQSALVARHLGDLKRECLQDDYVSQADLLEKVHQAQQIDVFVAKYQILENNSDGSLASYCAWVKGVEGLLPQTDLVALLVIGPDDEIQSQKMVAWDELQALVGDMLQAQDGYPVRYRVTDFPTAEQMAQLTAR